MKKILYVSPLSVYNYDGLEISEVVEQAKRDNDAFFYSDYDNFIYDLKSNFINDCGRLYVIVE